MGFLSRLLGKVKNDEPQFSEGDIFYCLMDNEYHLYKLLKHDAAFETYHVLAYEPLQALPAISDIGNLEILVYHTPIAVTGFESPVLFTKDKVRPKDLLGYCIYLRHTDNIEELVKIAKAYYIAALNLSDQNKHYQAIESYTNAIDALPEFFEAIDNRAFCKMDLALYPEAIEDFNLSLQVKPDSTLAIFSIGECYLRLLEFDKAKEYFERTLALEANNRGATLYLSKAINQEPLPVYIPKINTN